MWNKGKLGGGGGVLEDVKGFEVGDGVGVKVGVTGKG